jgi:adenine phosphoribosyltransferase
VVEAVSGQRDASRAASSAAVESARVALLARFAWVHGHADIWRVFQDADAFAAVVEGIAAPWRDARVTTVVGIESRGFLLGGAVAVALGAGFVPVRKEAGLLPGPKLTVVTAPDYRENVNLLRMQAVLTASDRVLLVDDWAERGAQATAVRGLIERSGAEYVGASLLVDQLPDGVRAELEPLAALVRASELPDDLE